MKNVPKPEKISLGRLLNQLQDGSFVIPDFQREFEWQAWDVQELLDEVGQKSAIAHDGIATLIEFLRNAGV